jgi:N-acyl-D-amino-acid deacylase
MTWDILIRHGTLIDGSGRPGTICDIALLAGRIAAIGPSLAADANKVIDADGLSRHPRFIDIKTHSDFVLPINPKAESKFGRVSLPRSLAIVGSQSRRPCPKGAGPCPLPQWRRAWLPFREISFAEYLDTFPPVAVNAGMLVGHNTLRLMVMGLEDRVPTEAELGQMIALLEDGLRAGALGMSSGLFTPPAALPNRTK